MGMLTLTCRLVSSRTLRIKTIYIYIENGFADNFFPNLNSTSVDFPVTGEVI